MQLKDKIIKKAKTISGKIILPEASTDQRVYEACKKILKNKLAEIIVFGKIENFEECFICPACTIIDIKKDKRTKTFAERLYELRKEKGLTQEEATKLIKQPEYFACMLLREGYADGMVAGAQWTTANTLRPALQIIKTKPNKKVVTGAMLMTKPNCKPMVFADISLVVNPTSEQLSEIAISSAQFYKQVVGGKPKVALLSYSTNGSAESEFVSKVRQAKELSQNCGYEIDGEMQADAALNKLVAQKKYANSKVAGQANVLIFPNLEAGNIGYKLVARLAGYTAIGPIMLNFNKPVNDLSRGCTVEEIILTTCITKLQIK